MWASLTNEWIKLFRMKGNQSVFFCATLFVSVYIIFLAYRFENQTTDQWMWMIEYSWVMYLILIVGVGLASQTVALEYRFGTAKMIFIRPIKRVKQIIGKWFACLSITFTIAIFFLLLGYVASGFLYDFQSIPHDLKFVKKIAYSYLIPSVQLVIVMSTAFFISIISSKPWIVFISSLIFWGSGFVLQGWFGDTGWWSYSLFSIWDWNLQVTLHPFQIQSNEMIIEHPWIHFMYLMFVHLAAWILISRKTIE